MSRFLLTRGIATLAAIAISCSSVSLGRLVIAGVALYAGVAFCSGTRSTSRLLTATLVMAVPLLLVHGIINPQFAVSNHLFTAPVRVAGIEYALVVSARLALMFGVVGLWVGTPRRTWIALVAASRVPPAWGVALLQAVTLSHLLAIRITRIQQAQRSRGILRDDMGLIARAGAAAAVIVPLTAVTLIDAAERGELLHRMGLGSYALLPATPLGKLELIDVMLAISVATLASFLILS